MGCMWTPKNSKARISSGQHNDNAVSSAAANLDETRAGRDGAVETGRVNIAMITTPTSAKTYQALTPASATWIAPVVCAMASSAMNVAHGDRRNFLRPPVVGHPECPPECARSTHRSGRPPPHRTPARVADERPNVAVGTRLPIGRGGGLSDVEDGRCRRSGRALSASLRRESPHSSTVPTINVSSR